MPVSSLPTSAPLLTPAAFEPRRVVPHLFGAALAQPVRLGLHPLPLGQAYSVVSFWEERLTGQVRRTTLTKTIELAATEQGGALRVGYEASAPEFQKPDLSSFERVLLLLATLYQRLELRVAQSGQLLAVLNEAAFSQTWAAIKQELRQRSGGGDEFTQLLIDGVEAQLTQPGAVLASLRLDYLFGFLWQNVYGQLFESGFRYEQAKAFPRFFAGADLWFSERLELLPPAVAGQVTVRLGGPLDLERTDTAAVARQIDKELRDANAGATSTDPATLHGTYVVTCQLDPATGWPLALDASVRCQAGEAYSKEYFLRFESVPAV